MSKIGKGICLIGSGIWEMIIKAFLFIVGSIVRAALKVSKEYRRRKLKRATAYVNKYGFELDLNSRVRLDGKAYYVFSFQSCRDIEERREVEVALIGVPQYKEIKRRLRA